MNTYEWFTIACIYLSAVNGSDAGKGMLLVIWFIVTIFHLIGV